MLGRRRLGSDHLLVSQRLGHHLCAGSVSAVVLGSDAGDSSCKQKHSLNQTHTHTRDWLKGREHRAQRPLVVSHRHRQKTI